MNQNIVLDFSRPDMGQQDLAVLPANLAKRLLESYAKKLKAGLTTDIMDSQLECLKRIRDNGTYEGFVQANLDFVMERQLIDNISDGNWDAYKVKEVVATLP